MKFIFKMLVLVGMILVGKFLKEDASTTIVKQNGVATQNIYSLGEKPSLPFAQPTNQKNEPVTKIGNPEKNFTYSLN
ncbi:hypothetical protein [Rufibacter sp. LB8]|uniref:hypothetical protein n=1 Tax=Rufibacter sp. LB8 TaxID=2777781 RepID=UPI00178C1CA4|nr:hypothetical protein [Rufibacter sp. LB8]